MRIYDWVLVILLLGLLGFEFYMFWGGFRLLIKALNQYQKGYKISAVMGYPPKEISKGNLIFRYVLKFSFTVLAIIFLLINIYHLPTTFAILYYLSCIFIVTSSFCNCNFFADCNDYILIGYRAFKKDNIAAITFDEKKTYYPIRIKLKSGKTKRNYLQMQFANCKEVIRVINDVFPVTYINKNK